MCKCVYVYVRVCSACLCVYVCVWLPVWEKFYGWICLGDVCVCVWEGVRVIVGVCVYVWVGCLGESVRMCNSVMF